MFHKPELDSARNNIHPNHKQKPEIANKNTWKNVNIDSQAECESGFQANLFIFTFNFRSSD